MIERLNMLGATPESSSEAAKPADDPHGRFTFGTSLDSYGTRPAGFGRVKDLQPRNLDSSIERSPVHRPQPIGATPPLPRPLRHLHSTNLGTQVHSTRRRHPSTRHARVCNGAMCQDGCHIEDAQREVAAQ
jgi:hypothetical protein